MKKINLTSEEIATKCLTHLEKFSKDDLLNEIEQLLLCLSEKGTDLTKLETYYSQNYSQRNQL
tara:strand:- start:3485 stop:3673 length:189 start_codon:yes stop_codon:yes gene_type:complete